MTRFRWRHEATRLKIWTQLFNNVGEHLDKVQCSLPNACETVRYNRRAHQHKQVRESEARRTHDECVVERETCDVERIAETVTEQLTAGGRVPDDEHGHDHRVNSPATP